MHHGEQLSSECRDQTNYNTVVAAAAAATMVMLNVGTIAQLQQLHRRQSSREPRGWHGNQGKQP